MMALPLVVPELEVGQRARTQLKNMAKNFSVRFVPKISTRSEGLLSRRSAGLLPIEILT